MLGGATRDTPILVSRVAPNTPADKCNPRLNEGDQIVQINGHDVTHALHNTVVDLIQEARRSNGGKSPQFNQQKKNGHKPFAIQLILPTLQIFVFI